RRHTRWPRDWSSDVCSSDLKRKRPLPRFPCRVALVTSPTGAAVRDMLKVLAGRWPGLVIHVVPVRVQGDGAAVDIAAKLRQLDRSEERRVGEAWGSCGAGQG